MHALLQFFVDALFPPQCAPCGRKLPRTARFLAICEECYARIPLRSGFSCAECGRRLPALINTCHHGTPVVAAATDFQNKETRALIHALKYHYVTDAAIPLAHILHRYSTCYLPASAYPALVVVPIPLHPKRLRARGFNQSMRIAQALAKLDARIRIEEYTLQRTHNTVSQTTAPSHEKREENIKDAFTASPFQNSPHIPIFILDDVCTSGSTLTEASRALRAQGTRHIVGLVVARA